MRTGTHRLKSVLLSHPAASISPINLGSSVLLEKSSAKIVRSGAASDLTDLVAYNQQHSDKYPYGQEALVASDATPGDGYSSDAADLAVRAANQKIDAVDVSVVEGMREQAERFKQEGSQLYKKV